MSIEHTSNFTLTSDLERFHFVSQFLAREAKLLDERRFEEWIAMVDDQIVYEVSHRQAMMEYQDEFTAGAFRLRDDMPNLRARVDRLSSGYAWAETPPSRTLRVVGSILVTATDEPDIVESDSALLIYRQRGSVEPGHIIPVRRSDQIRITEDGGRLLSRRASIPDTVLQTPNLGIFL